MESLPLYNSMAGALHARLAAAVDAALTPDALVDSLRTAQESKRIHARCASLSNWSELELAVQLLRRKIVAAFVAAGDVPHVPEHAALLAWDNGKVDLALALRDYAVCPLPMPTAMAQVAPGCAACATLACPHCRRPLSLDVRLECTAVQGACQSDLIASSMLTAAPGRGPATDRQAYWAHCFLACARRLRRGHVQKASNP